MYAITVARPGGPEAMEWRQVPDPSPNANEVVIDIAATAVNRADILQRKGFYPPPAGASPYLGLECSGTVSELGADVTNVQVGDEVCALLTGGGYAQRVAVPVGQVMPIPVGTSLITAASLPEVSCTVWSNLINVAEMESGNVVLIHGGAGGIGTHAIQMARALGATVAVTVGTDERGQICRELGAKIVVNYRTEDFVELIRMATDGAGANIILDNMGAKYLERNIEALAPGGRLIVIGLQGGIKAELNLATLLNKRASVHATSLRGRPESQKSAICSEVTDCIWPMIEADKIHPVVDSVVPIADVAAAHARMEESAHIGKIILTIA